MEKIKVYMLPMDVRLCFSAKWGNILNRFGIPTAGKAGIGEPNMFGDQDVLV
jgi:hypothetical protein